MDLTCTASMLIWIQAVQMPDIQGLRTVAGTGTKYGSMIASTTAPAARMAVTQRIGAIRPEKRAAAGATAEASPAASLHVLVPVDSSPLEAVSISSLVTLELEVQLFSILQLWRSPHVPRPRNLRLLCKERPSGQNVPATCSRMRGPIVLNMRTLLSRLVSTPPQAICSPTAMVQTNAHCIPANNSIACAKVLLLLILIFLVIKIKQVVEENASKLIVFPNHNP